MTELFKQKLSKYKTTFFRGKKVVVPENFLKYGWYNYITEKMFLVYITLIENINKKSEQLKYANKCWQGEFELNNENKIKEEKEKEQKLSVLYHKYGYQYPLNSKQALFMLDVMGLISLKLNNENSEIEDVIINDKLIIPEFYFNNISKNKNIKNKVMIYVLRNNYIGQVFTLKEISLKIGVTVKDAKNIINELVNDGIVSVCKNIKKTKTNEQFYLYPTEKIYSLINEYWGV